jgi:hypothetical protein
MHHILRPNARSKIRLELFGPVTKLIGTKPAPACVIMPGGHDLHIART